jgi:hypothetical protein
VAATHPELAGVVAESHAADPVNAIFGDPRARLVPARLLVRDRYDLDAAAGALRVPSLWFERPMQDEESEAYAKVAAQKMIVWVNPSADANKQFEEVVSRWLDEMPVR